MISCPTVSKRAIRSHYDLATLFYRLFWGRHIHHAFFRRAARWLRPGGRLALCAWLAGDTCLDDEATRQVYEVCEGFLCPSLGARDDYAGWITGAGLTLERDLDWTSNVAHTWELCEERVRRTGVRSLARLLDRDSVVFLDRFRTILEAYRSGAMKYGCFIARAP